MSAETEGNQDANRITEVAVLKTNEANKIRELYRVIGGWGVGGNSSNGEGKGFGRKARS